MNVSHRHSAGGWLTAVALGALVLTSCGQEPSDRLDPAAAAGPAPSSTAGDATDTTDATDDDRTHDSGKSADPAASGEKASPSARAGDQKGDQTGDRTSDRADTVRKSAAPAHSPAPDRRTAAPTASKDTSATTGNAPFAGTAQFVTISKAWTGNGRTYLAVRPARKEINSRFDTWEITPGTGPFTTVPMADNGQVRLAVPVRDEVAGTSRAELVAYSPDRLVTLIGRLDPTLSGGIGYDLVFDGTGRVTGLTSLYRP
ncbi:MULTISPECIES: hypothetical protein [unclassified Streptomyces]|uniref:hypothetical protein n=1 Tax=unclassified Streptomyces TaxID=2593676 RepID=UPI000851BC62|nr:MULTISPECIES: hypothetical protein [unclassified Streptomyces]MDX3489334.1 hypothetical protein [Streptomyces sp. ID05-18]